MRESRTGVWVLLGAMTVATSCGGSGPAVVAPEGGEAPPETVTGNIPEVEGKHGVVFAPEGEALELRVLATGQSVPVTDGTPLRLVSEQSGPGLGRADAEVEIGGQIGILPNTAVLVGERLRRSQNGAVTLFIATRECEPECVSQIWALHRDGRKLRLADDAPRPQVAFSPDGYQVAAYNQGLWLLHIGTWRAYRYKEFTAAAFAPDGALFVRARGATDTVLQMLFGGQVAEVLSEPGTPTSPEPAPVTFEDGGKTVVATFARAGGDTVRRAYR